ncbi:MAG: DUF423 domain-containing protein [Candidatus Omnitrophica bacterium]|nr:DUF423 domain-containing protein [Candidatus Omnitrophota bacterium]
MIWIRYGSLVMLLGVALGAFGAHGLKDTLTPEGKQIYHTAVFYHLIHGLALLAVGWLATLKPSEPLIRNAGVAFVLGILLFSGSLYLLSVTGIKKLGIITPFGGLALLIGWLLLALSAKP